ncbi:hypothetical protein V6N11_046435 [Hibiscus sabdariffa]|uniref:Uncharacterized protein n=1 Tax=Hibiscus sabdariffa TaxID=183260 RepID=A0ABR2P2V7_9ROSI
MREAETAVLMFEGAWVVDRRIQVNLAKYKCRDNYWRKKHPQGVPRVAAHQINRLCGDDTGRRANENVRLPASHKPSYLGKNVDKKNPVVLETSSSESSASSDQVEKPASPGEKLFETNEALNDASLEIPSNNCASIQVEFAARSVEKSNLVGCRTEANLEGSGVGGFSNKGLSDGSTKSQCKEHGPKWVDVVKGGAARLPYSDPKEGSPCLNQAVADLNSVGLQGIDLSKNDDVELDVNRAADEDPKNICPGGAVMAQEMLVDNLVVSIGSKEVEREELSGRISPVLEHRKMDHVTLELPEFQSITKPAKLGELQVEARGHRESSDDDSAI